MTKRGVYRVALSAAAICSSLCPAAFGAAKWTVVGWNDLGMHCMDADFSVFSLLPPYNTFHAQLIDSNGKLVKTGAGYRITYEAVADATASINRSSVGKTNFWSNVNSLFGATLSPDVGLTGFSMPGTTPRAMRFDQPFNWWTGEGVPITPYDDARRKNYYPMMQLVARNSSGTVLATTRIVLPVSDEMDCRACHASNSVPAARPAAGWVGIANNADRDYKLNILRLHDERSASANYSTLLGKAGYNAAGLYATAIGGKAVLCAKCHSSNALPGVGIGGAKALTAAIHGRHANATDPVTGLTLNNAANRAACYRCHPGSETKCLRGAMGNAVAFDGSMQMQCQSCHGSMSDVGSTARAGWFDEPTCQNCHTGTAVRNSGQIRFTSVYSAPGVRRAAADLTFATKPNTPAAGVSLYRFSTGHGGLQCEACHGSTHAEYASTHANDNVQSIALQGHVGTLAECSTCHASVPSTVSGGPHGMHPVGQSWVSGHGDAAEKSGTGACQNCHGGDLRGTVLSRSFANRTLQTEFGTNTLWRGFQIGCYNCHNGPRSESANRNRAAVVQNLALAARIGQPSALTLKASDADNNPLTLRIVSQPAHGVVALNGTSATYFPDAGYAGADTFTYAAWDGSTDSNLGTVSVTVR